MCKEYNNGFCIVCGQPRIPAVRIPKDYGVGIIIPNMDIKRDQKHIILTPRNLGKTHLEKMLARQQFINKVKGLPTKKIEWKMGKIATKRAFLENPASDELNEQFKISK